MRAFSAMLLPLLLTASAGAQEVEIAANPIAELVQETEIDGGTASYYGNELAGNRTASGERFDPGQLTAAHRTLPFGSKVRVTNMSTGDSVIVRINDRGPFAHGRVIDVSRAAAREIGMHRSGTARVKLALLTND
ncbi:septal ring lytic transglycosylase RlpA family protein [Sphingopyxis kveilinensis]|uniref:septal ring lytic transglycosylase RlpA family protein n=1 Tax=Sphingopyxis kveilinensis TaxID=3114367 RepID=UPI0030D4D44D